MTQYDIYLRKDADRPISKEHCRAFVYGWVSSTQCQNKAKHFRHVKGYDEPIGFCGIHDPERIAKRKAKQDEKYRAQNAAYLEKRNAEMAERALKSAALDAIRQIADGHNDPRALALAVLEQKP